MTYRKKIARRKMRPILLAGSILTMTAVVSHGFAAESRREPESILSRHQPTKDVAAVFSGTPIGLFAEGGIGSSDNVFLVDDDAANRVDDLFAEISVSAAAKQLFRVYEVTVAANAKTRQYIDENESALNRLGFFGDVAWKGYKATEVSLAANYLNTNEAKNSAGLISGTVAPVQLASSGLSLVAQHMFANNTSFLASVSFANTDYDDLESRQPNGQLFIIDQDFRDNDRIQFGVKLERDLPIGPTVYIDTARTMFEYESSPSLFPVNSVLPVDLNRDSTATSLKSGIIFGQDDLYTTNIEIGYKQQDFDSSFAETVEGFVGVASLKYRPTKLTEMEVFAERDINISPIIGSFAFTRDSIGAEINHDWSDRVLLSGSMSFSRDEFNDSNREDNVWLGQVGVGYRVTENVVAQFDFTRFQRDIDFGIGPDQAITENSPMISLKWQR